MKGIVPSLALGNLNAADNLEFDRQSNDGMHDAYATLGPANF